MSENQPSKSANKRAARKISALAQQLLKMPAEQRERLVSDDEDVSDAIQLAARLKREARRRQTMHVANLLRDRPDLVSRIESTINAADLERRREAASFRRTESTRDGLLRGDADALALVSASASTDQLDRIKALCKQHEAAIGDRERRTVFRELFRITHSVLGG